ncbi:MAG: hypothetical protein ACI4MY_03890 [Christensenellales bacterium]
MKVWVIKRNDGTYWGRWLDFTTNIAYSQMYGHKTEAKSVCELVAHSEECNVVAVEIKEIKENSND